MDATILFVDDTSGLQREAEGFRTLAASDSEENTIEDDLVLLSSEAGR